ncbi:hypothetical protein F4804DRAFT_348688 [Jackrogersella minutella]|nr:hypothetical protein F4804DRAFT_348688 [Jackrogersella minutella]
MSSYILIAPPRVAPVAVAACRTLRSGYTQYCSDVGASTVAGIPTFSAGWNISVPTVSETTTTTTSAGSSPAAEADSPSSTSASGSEGGGGSSLSTGSIAGIAVGGAGALVLITGGLLLFAFRLGKGYSSRKKDGEAGAPPPPPPPPTDPGQQEEGEIVKTEKAQLEGQPVSELSTEYTLSGFDPVKELPTQERPAEFSADPLPRYTDEGSPVLSHSPW